VRVFPLALDWDGSLTSQPALCARMEAILPFKAIGEALRVWAEPGCAMEVLRRLAPLHERHRVPWVAFLGSGDYHHMTLVLLESLPADQRPSTLVVVDNHPDWFLESPSCHCGNWVGTALKTLPWLKQVIVIGVDSDDLKGYRFWRAPWDDLCRGRLQIHPYRKSKVTIPFRRCKSDGHSGRARETWMGVEWTFPTLVSRGVGLTFEDLATALRGQSVYLSLDKDCLRRDQLETDWEQGGLRIEELLAGVRTLSAAVHLCGVDICGDKAARPLQNWAKRLDTGRWFSSGSSRTVAPDYHVHERVNLALLECFGADNPGWAPACQ